MTKIFGKDYQNLVAMTIGIGRSDQFLVEFYKNLVMMTIGIGHDDNWNWSHDQFLVNFTKIWSR